MPHNVRTALRYLPLLHALNNTLDQRLRTLNQIATYWRYDDLVRCLAKCRGINRQSLISHLC